MKKIPDHCCAIVFCLVCSVFLFAAAENNLSAQEAFPARQAQDAVQGESESVRALYLRNFARANLASKPGILLDAQADELSSLILKPLYQAALQFALANGALLSDDADMFSLVSLAVRGALKEGDITQAETLWHLYALFPNPKTKVEILSALGVLGRGNTRIITALNALLETQTVDYEVLMTCIAALGSLSSSSSFQVLFAALMSNQSESINDEIIAALQSIRGNFTDAFIDLIKSKPFSEKTVAFRIGTRHARLSAGERAKIAHAALEASIDASGTLEDSLRYDAITALTSLRWQPSSALAVRNFYRVQIDFSNGIIPKARFLEAAIALGAMPSPEAVQALALQLGYLNAQTERTGRYDTDIVMALIRSLGQTRDGSAFSQLVQVSTMPYTAEIQNSAREALSRLR